jgi:hypothetical protein
MNAQEREQDVLDRLVRWEESRDAVRALLLFSSRADPAAPVDAFSDYDVLTVVTDIRPFPADAGWLEDFGRVLVVFRNPIGLDERVVAYIQRIQRLDRGAEVFDGLPRSD